MVAPGLVLALLGFLEIRLLLVCLDEAEEGGKLDPVLDLVAEGEENLFVQGYEAKDVATMLAWHRVKFRDSILVVCEGEQLPPGLARPDFTSSTFWLTNREAVTEELYKVLSLESNVLTHSVFSVNGTTQVWLEEHYSIKSTIPMRNSFGLWDLSSGLHVPETSRWERRSNLQEVTLINTALPWADLIKMKSGNNTIRGFFPDLLSLLGNILNFRVETIRPPDGKWATREPLENGTLTWTGMVKQLMQGDADLAMAMTETADRSRVVDYTVGILEQGLSLILIDPAIADKGQGQVNLLVFLSVFTLHAWLAIATSVMAFSAVSTILTLFPNKDRVKLSDIWTEFGEGIHYFYLELIQRNGSTGEDLVFISAKIFFLTCSALCFILLSYYEGDLTATMTVGTAPPSLNSFEDVLNSDYSFHTNPGAVMYDMLQLADPETAKRKLFERKLKPMLETEFQEWQMRKPSRAVYFGSQFNAGPDTNFVFLHNFEDYMSTTLGIIMQKESEFKRIFDYHIRKLDQAGVLKKLGRKWFEGNRPDDMTHRIFQNEAQALGYENLAFPALVMLCGVAVGAVVVVFEKISSRVDGLKRRYSAEPTLRYEQNMNF